MAKVDMFLKLDGIDGESTDKKHGKEIEPDAIRVGVHNYGKTGSGTGGAGAGRVRPEDFHFRALPSKASPNLMLYCCSGQTITNAKLTIRVAGKDQQERIVYTMTNVLISSYRSGLGFDVSETPEGFDWSIEGGQTATDDWVQYDYFSLNYATLQMAYSAQKPDGTVEGALTKGWNFTTNVSI